jgi:hypothetical protein
MNNKDFKIGDIVHNKFNHFAIVIESSDNLVKILNFNKNHMDIYIRVDCSLWLKKI